MQMPSSFIGVDVSKAELVIAVHGQPDDQCRLRLRGGVSAGPAVSVNPSVAMTRRSVAVRDRAKAGGDGTPYVSWPTAIAKLTVTTLNPVAVFRGERNRSAVN